AAARAEIRGSRGEARAGAEFADIRRSGKHMALRSAAFRLLHSRAFAAQRGARVLLLPMLMHRLFLPAHPQFHPRMPHAVDDWSCSFHCPSHPHGRTEPIPEALPKGKP